MIQGRLQVSTRHACEQQQELQCMRNAHFNTDKCTHFNLRLMRSRFLSFVPTIFSESYAAPAPVTSPAPAAAPADAPAAAPVPEVPSPPKAAEPAPVIDLLGRVPEKTLSVYVLGFLISIPLKKKIDGLHQLQILLVCGDKLTVIFWKQLCVVLKL